MALYASPYYLQFSQVQLLPQLQFSQVQLGLPHFCLSLGVTILMLNSCFILFCFIVLIDKTKLDTNRQVVVTLLWVSLTKSWVKYDVSGRIVVENVKAGLRTKEKFFTHRVLNGYGFIQYLHSANRVNDKCNLTHMQYLCDLDCFFYIFKAMFSFWVKPEHGSFRKCINKIT